MKDQEISEKISEIVLNAVAATYPGQITGKNSLFGPKYGLIAFHLGYALEIEFPQIPRPNIQINAQTTAGEMIDSLLALVGILKTAGC